MNKAVNTILVVLATFLLSACSQIGAKCPLLFIKIESEVRGVVPDGSRLEVDISPDPNAVQEAISSEDGMFSGQIKFDTTRSGGRFHHDCSRRPIGARIALVHGEEVLGQALLTIAADFEIEKDGDYYLKKPVQFDIDSGEGQR